MHNEQIERLTQALHGFVKQHLGAWLQIVSLSLQTDPSVITSEEFDILGLVLCGGTSKTQPLWKLSDALPDLASKSSMAAADLRKAVGKLLSWNEDIYTIDVAKDGLEPRAKTLNLSNVLKGIWFHRPGTSTALLTNSKRPGVVKFEKTALNPNNSVHMCPLVSSTQESHPV